jgi:hypothetical protein
MRKTRGISDGADRSTGRSASIVVCVRKFPARSLVGDKESAPRLQVMGSTERARSEWEFHGAAPMRKGGERSWNWAAVSLSRTTLGPPHWGQSQSGFMGLASAAVGLDCDGGSGSSSRSQSGRRAVRRRLARKPKWGMPAPGGGATARDGSQHREVLPGDPAAASFDEDASRGANQIGHLKGWPVHLRVLR